MAYTDDWETLMNGVFGAGGKLKFGGAQPGEKPQAAKPAGSPLPDLNAALQENQRQLDELLKKQNAQLKAQDAAAQSALDAAGYGSGRPAGQGYGRHKAGAAGQL